MSCSRRRAVLLLATLAGIWIGSDLHAQLPGNLPLTPPPPINHWEKIDPLLLSAVSQPTRRSPVIVRAQSPALVGAADLLIQQLGGQQRRTLPIIEAIAADVPNTALMLLANNSIIRRVALDRRSVATLERTGATIGASFARQEFGLDGTGVGVAVIDSGVTSWHDDLAAGPGTQRIDAFVDFVNGGGSAYDDNGHGTHVAGIIAGNGYDSGGARSGIAPGARVVGLKVLDANGQGRISNIIAAFDYLVAHRDSLPVRVINVSVGAQVAESYDTDVLTQAAKRAVDAGFVVVVAAGNNGRVNGQTQYAGITAPGNAPWVLTVGASSHQGTIDRNDDIVAAFSSRGPTIADFNAKPDLVAPGVGIESLSDPGSTLYTTRSSSRLNGTVDTSYMPYLSLSGTSQATPVVAGTVALMLQANPALTPNAVKAILQFTSQKYEGYDALTQGAGFLNAHGAIELAKYFADPSAPYPSRTGWSEQLIWGTHRITGGLILPNSTAWSPGAAWGAAKRDGEWIDWGQIWTPSDNEAGGTWTTWGTSCAGQLCQSVRWGSPDSENVVWGATCGGSDCIPPSTGGWVAHTSDQTWGLSEQDAVVWGTTGDDGVVWGTTGDDGVVWGTTGDDGVVWGTTCPDGSCE